MVELAPFLAYDFPSTTVYALWFLLGSFAVSGLSDLRRMSAQREFMEVWILFTAAVFVLDAWRVYNGADLVVHGVKWVLILLAGLFSWRGVGGLFRLARGDVWAIVAVCSLFNPLFVVLYMGVLKLTDILTAPLFRRFGSGGAYPFIPAVLIATLITVAVILTDVVGRAIERV